jgi:hypothetical protein
MNESTSHQRNQSSVNSRDRGPLSLSWLALQLWDGLWQKLSAALLLTFSASLLLGLHAAMPSKIIESQILLSANTGSVLSTQYERPRLPVVPRSLDLEVKVEQLQTDSAARPDPFTGTDGAHLQSQVDRLEDRVQRIEQRMQP